VTFREDLYSRLKLIPIELPPLRTRREDIEPIASLLLSRACTRTGRALRFSPDALRILLSYGWPGNVRELENALEFAAIVCQGQTLQPEDLPPEVVAAVSTRATAPAEQVAAPGPRAPSRTASGRTPSDEDERVALEHALEAHRWNRAETASALGMSRSTLWRRMRALELA